jgi:hypothetical protein
MAGKHEVTRQKGRHCRQLPLDTAQECFCWLVTGPEPLSMDGRQFAGLPDRPLPLDDLRGRLLQRSCPRSTRDAVWGELVRRSRERGATWTLACAGMALPALGGTSRWLAARFPGDLFDIQAEVLSGFLGGLAAVDVDRPGVLVRLRWSAYRSGYAALTEALDAPTPLAPGFPSAAPRPPTGHPDLVLARAVCQSVLTKTEADLIGATRLDRTSVADWAAAHRMTRDAAYKARRRAEHRLADFLRDQARDADPDNPVATSVLTGLAAVLPGGRVPSSHSVTSTSSDRTKEDGSVSKARGRTGLVKCGETPPAAPSVPPSEEYRCA